MANVMTETKMRFLTVPEVAELLRVTPQTVRMWVAKGSLPRPSRIGHQWLFNEETLMASIKHAER
jgi:excisionase family DNA binding protein